MHLDPFWVSLCLWCEAGIKIHSYASGETVIPAPFVEKTTFFSAILPLLLCQRSIDCIYVGLFLSSFFCFIDVYPFANSAPLISIAVIIEIGLCVSSKFVLQRCGDYSGTLTLESVCWYLQNIFWDFNRDSIESIDQIGKIDVLPTTVSFPVCQPSSPFVTNGIVF